MKSKKNNPWARLPSCLLALLLGLLAAGPALAQATAAAAANQPEMADALRRDGKIYVVVLVVVLIVAGLLLYLLRLDGKMSKLEKEVE